MNKVLERIKRFVTGESSVVQSGMTVRTSTFQTYTLDTTRVNYTIARELYQNVNSKYKLGAGFVKPIIHTIAGFMGTPHFISQNSIIQEELESMETRWSGKFGKIHINTLVDGDCFVRIERVEDRFTGRPHFELSFIPPENIVPIINPLTGILDKVFIKHEVPVYDEQGNITGHSIITETITNDTVEIIPDTRAPLELQAIAKIDRNIWGFIPVIHFKNEANENRLYGRSEIEAVEPYLKAYHDTLLFAIQGAKLFARPKVKFKLASVENFLTKNFSEEEISSGKLRFQDKEIFLLQEGDDIEFITADSGLQAITTLLQFIYYCIVDTSETPEFVFGTAVSSSKASVSEQMIPLAKKIERKRKMFEDYYQEFIQTYLVMYSRVEGIKLDDEIDIVWDEVNSKNDKDVAETINTLVSGLTGAVETGIMSLQSASEFLKQYIPTMRDWESDEKDNSEKNKIALGYALKQRLEDGLIEQVIGNEQ